jgi:large subunit ribosomal protein L34e
VWVWRSTRTHRHTRTPPMVLECSFVASTKTPGGRVTYQYVKKLGTVPKCGDCGVNILGVPAVRPKEVRCLPGAQNPPV